MILGFNGGNNGGGGGGGTPVIAYGVQLNSTTSFINPGAGNTINWQEGGPAFPLTFDRGGMFSGSGDYINVMNSGIYAITFSIEISDGIVAQGGSAYVLLNDFYKITSSTFVDTATETATLSVSCSSINLLANGDTIRCFVDNPDYSAKAVNFASVSVVQIGT